jgi:hypothetical protein
VEKLVAKQWILLPERRRVAFASSVSAAPILFSISGTVDTIWRPSWFEGPGEAEMRGVLPGAKITGTLLLDLGVDLEATNHTNSHLVFSTGGTQFPFIASFTLQIGDVEFWSAPGVQTYLLFGAPMSYRYRMAQLIEAVH